MDDATRTSVVERASNQCEYCRLPQSAQPSVTFHVDHVVATDQIVRVFNPPTDRWNEHFQFADYVIVGLTDIGRATLRLLAMNAPSRIELRQLSDPG